MWDRLISRHLFIIWIGRYSQSHTNKKQKTSLSTTLDLKKNPFNLPLIETEKAVVSIHLIIYVTEIWSAENRFNEWSLNSIKNFGNVQLNCCLRENHALMQSLTKVLTSKIFQKNLSWTMLLGLLKPMSNSILSDQYDIVHFGSNWQARMNLFLVSSQKTSY